MKVLLLRLEAPLMSFGAPTVDKFGVIQPYPALSLICGLLANALGYHHRDVERLQRLQERIRYASRQDRAGSQLRDYQTVDLGADYMSDDRAWTTRGELEQRGGASGKETHIRLRDYLVDSAHTVALSLEPDDEAPTLSDLELALRRPERPLFIGRKTCLPAEPLFLDRVEATDLVSALQHAPLARNADKPPFRVWYSTSDRHQKPGVEYHSVTDRRDWKNQIHVGQRWMATTDILVTAKEVANG